MGEFSLNVLAVVTKGGGGVALGELKLSVNRKILNPVGSQADGMPLYGVLPFMRSDNQISDFPVSDDSESQTHLTLEYRSV